MKRILDERDKHNLESSINATRVSFTDQMENLKEDTESDLKQMSKQMSIFEDEVDKRIYQLDYNISNDINSLNKELTSKINNVDRDLSREIDTLETQMSTNVDNINTNIETLRGETTTLISDLDTELSAQISNLETNKVDKDGDKVLSENDLTDTLKSQYDDAYEHSQDDHAPSDAEMNVQANWAEEDNTSDAYIQNKPTLGAMAAKSVVEKSDLSEDVQTSLELADTSLQSYTETDPTVPSWAKEANKPVYTAIEVGALPDTTVIPSKVSELTNDSGFITSYTETDPTVPSWAKAETKPTYTASEVGALPDTTEALKNPYGLTFIGASSDVYDGSAAVTVNIPVLPAITAEDEGKVLCVVNGVYSLVSISELQSNTEGA